MSANEVLPDGSLREICAERGMCVGGQNVNEAFFQTLATAFQGLNFLFFQYYILLSPLFAIK